MGNVWLTTTDNPWDPFTQFDQWFGFDSSKGYMTCQYLARLAPQSSEVSEEVNDAELERFIDDACRLNLVPTNEIGIQYRKVYRDGKS